MTQREIILVPRGGLCNRLRAIASGIKLAKDEKIPLTIYWHNSKDCACWFGDLFEPLDSKICKADGGITLKDENGLWHTAAHKKNLYIPYLFRKPFFSKELINYNSQTAGDVKHCIPDNGKVFVATGNVWYEMYPLDDIFVPRHDLVQDIEKVTAKFSSNTVGLHIRRTDNKQSIKAASVADFCELMDKEIEKNAETTFYLATDDAEVKEELRGKYGKRIISYDVPLRRDTLEGMHGAVIDLWCLARTSRIIGSFYSSYSEIAALIGGIQLDVIVK